MCTNQALKCLFVNSNKLNESMSSSSSEYNANYKHLNQIKIYFNRRLKVLTGIEDKTTFRDLITAILVSSKSVSSNKLDKEIDRYVICETMNSVEKCLDAELNVREELARLKSERALLNHDTSIVHTMRLKSSIKCLPMNLDKIELMIGDANRDESDNILVLEEFIGDQNQYLKTKIPKCDKSLKRALIKFDRHIEERKRYIRLLEDYLSMLESLEQFGQRNDDGQLIVYDSDSTDDTGFDSVSTSLESLFFSSNNCFSTYV